MHNQKNDEIMLVSNYNELLNINTIVNRCTAFDFDDSDKLLILSILISIVVAQRKIDFDDSNCPWANVSENFNKHRDPRRYDIQIQKILLYLGNINSYCVTELKCSDKGHYRAKIESIERNIVCFVMHSVKKDTQYLKDYFARNSDLDNCGFYYIKYDVDNKNDLISMVTLEIPDLQGTEILSYNLTDDYERVKMWLVQRNIYSFIEQYRVFLANLNQIGGE